MPGIKKNKLSVKINKDSPQTGRHWLEASGPVPTEEGDLEYFKNSQEWSPSPSPTRDKNLGTSRDSLRSGPLYKNRPITSLIRKIRARSASNGGRGRWRQRRRNRSIEAVSASSPSCGAGDGSEGAECIEMSHMGGFMMKKRFDLFTIYLCLFECYMNLEY